MNKSIHQISTNKSPVNPRNFHVIQQFSKHLLRLSCLWAPAIPAGDLEEEEEMSLLLNRSEQGITEFLKDVKHVIPNFKYQTEWKSKMGR